MIHGSWKKGLFFCFFALSMTAQAEADMTQDNLRAIFNDAENNRGKELLRLVEQFQNEVPKAGDSRRITADKIQKLVEKGDNYLVKPLVQDLYNSMNTSPEKHLEIDSDLAQTIGEIVGKSLHYGGDTLDQMTEKLISSVQDGGKGSVASTTGLVAGLVASDSKPAFMTLLKEIRRREDAGKDTGLTFIMKQTIAKTLSEVGSQLPESVAYLAEIGIRDKNGDVRAEAFSALTKLCSSKEEPAVWNQCLEAVPALRKIALGKDVISNLHEDRGAEYDGPYYEHPSELAGEVLTAIGRADGSAPHAAVPQGIQLQLFWGHND